MLQYRILSSQAVGRCQLMTVTSHYNNNKLLQITAVECKLLKYKKKIVILNTPKITNESSNFELNY